MRENPCLCPACGSTEAGPPASVPDHEYGLPKLASYARCLSCLTLYQVPMPSMEQLAETYPQDYHSFASAGLLMRLRCRLRMRRLERWLKTANSVILDYGCGQGHFLLEAARHFPEHTFWGYEIGPGKEVERLAEGRVTIVRGSPVHLLEELPQCDLITMNHVIEHLPDPLQVLLDLRDRLKPDGVLEGQTPAADSMERDVFGSYWSGYHAPRHTVIFSQSGLRTLFGRANLVRGSVTGGFNPAAIAVSLASLGHGRRGGKISRRGWSWICLLALATILAPFDLLSGRPGIINFRTEKGDG